MTGRSSACPLHSAELFESLPYCIMVSRREFIFSFAAAAGALIRPAFLPQLAEAAKATLSIGLVIPLPTEQPELSSFMHGATLGFNEATRAAKLFDRSVETFSETYASANQIEAAIATASKRSAQVIIGGSDDASARRIAELCQDARMLFVNAVSRDDTLRRAFCSPFVFHVEASNAMYESAASIAGLSATSIALWSPTLEKYGAAQLNDRYQAVSGNPMDSAAWAGWMSVKVVWEAYLRARSPDSPRIAAFLTRDNAHFDGHKGAPLSFRAWDHQLRQPLYALSPDGTRVLSEIPDVARSTRPTNDLLDGIGDRAGNSLCRGPVSK